MSDSNYFAGNTYLGLFRPDVAAEVPAVRLTHHEWARIQALIRDVASLSEAVGPRGLHGALVEGRLLTDAAQAARELRHLAGEEDE